MYISLLYCNVLANHMYTVFCCADLKKTLAVLLDNIMQRLSKLESKVDNIMYNGTSTNLTNGTGTPGPNSINPEKVNVAGTDALSRIEVAYFLVIFLFLHYCPPFQSPRPYVDLWVNTALFTHHVTHSHMHHTHTYMVFFQSSCLLYWIPLIFPQLQDD